MINSIIYIALLCVYSVIVIIVTLKAPQHVTKLKTRYKTRKLQKLKKQNSYIKKVVRDYLKELSNGS